MQFSKPLIQGIFLKRYKRFFVDVQLDNGEIVTAHTANTGSMKSALAQGYRVALAQHNNPKRKLPYSLELTHNGKTWIGVNTHLPNHLVQEALSSGQILELGNITKITPEIKISEQTRLDFLLNDNIYLEVKNVSMALPESSIAAFPDAVSVRAAKHLAELIKLKGKGFRAICLFVIQRDDVDCFTPAAMIDPDYAMEFDRAQRAGVEMIAYHFSPGPEGIFCKKRIKIIESEHTSLR